MSWYIVIKTIKGRRYRYRQRTWREGGRMRTKSEYIGPVGEGNRGERSRVGLEQATTLGRHRDVEHRSAGQGTETERTSRRVRRRANGVSEFLKELVRKRDRADDFGETEAQARERVAIEDAERAKDARVNDLLTAPTISLDTVEEIADMQADAQSEGEPEGSPDGSAE
ncbi:MAG: hypothetical protein ABSC22_00685 [Roseiarcus sp.]|jgi:hypothetical protein